MSHRDHASYLPYVTSVSPTTVADSGSQTITITGSGLTPTTEVSVPSSLGVLTGRSFVQNSSVSQSIVLTVTVAEPPATPTARSIGLKNSGLGTATTSVTHGFSPSSLLLNAGDEYYHPSTIPGATNDTKFYTWNAEVAAGQSPQTFSAPAGWTDNHPVYLDSAINGEPGVIWASYADVPAGHLWSSSAEESDAFTFAMVTRWATPAGASLGVDANSSYGWMEWGKGKFHYYPSLSGAAKAWISGTHNNYNVIAKDATVQHWIVTGSDSSTNHDWKESSTVLVDASASNSALTGLTKRLRSTHFHTGATGDLEWRVAEMLFLARELSAGEEAALVAYWQNLYGT